MTLYAGNSLTGAIYKGDQLICSSSGGGGGVTSGKYHVDQVIKDDSNNKIGVVSGFVSDGQLAVVTLFNSYRSNGYFLSTKALVSGIITKDNILEALNTEVTSLAATTANTKVLKYCSDNNVTSTAVSHCRSLSFVIGGKTYYGQLPMLTEVLMIFSNFYLMNCFDPNPISSHLETVWSCTQTNTNLSYVFYYVGTQDQRINAATKTNNYRVYPILELDNS
jgi:hypothetical protein